MKVKVPLALVVILAVAVGYFLGTESGRRRRDLILVKLGRTTSDQTPDPATDDQPAGGVGG